MNKRIYISGPMTGYANYNFEAFNEAAKRLRADGHVVLNPVELMQGKSTSNPRHEFMRLDLQALLEATSIYFLKGYSQSEGAMLEFTIARELNLEFFYEPLAEAEAESICREADHLVSVQRQQAYGHPKKNFSDIGKMWSAILGVNVTPNQVGLCMIAVKMCRHINKPKRDNLVDIAGYAKTLDLLNQ